MPELTVNTVKKVKDLDLIFGVLGADVDLRTFVAQMITTLELFALEIRNRLKELEKATDVVGIMFIAEVDSDADTGGGYYKCHLQTLDATDWDTTTADQVDDKGDEVIVLNLPEMGGSTWSLSAGDLIQCFKFRDDEKNVRYVGVELLGQSGSGIATGATQLAKTQEAAQADGEISVKLLGSDGNETGSAFDVYAFLDEAATDFTTIYWLADKSRAIESADILTIFKGITGNWYLTPGQLYKRRTC